MMITVHIAKEKLSDGSEVFNVYLGDEDRTPIMAYSQRDAEQLADVIVTAIDNHSASQARVRAW